MTTFYCLRFETPPAWRTRSPYLYPPGTGWPSYTPRHWIPFPSPFTTRRTTVEVFEPGSTREGILWSRLASLHNPSADRVSHTVPLLLCFQQFVAVDIGFQQLKLHCVQWIVVTRMHAYSCSAWEWVHPAVGWQWTFTTTSLFRL
jgi:hypothetical protein